MKKFLLITSVSLVTLIMAGCAATNTSKVNEVQITAAKKESSGAVKKTAKQSHKKHMTKKPLAISETNNTTKAPFAATNSVKVAKADAITDASQRTISDINQ